MMLLSQLIDEYEQALFKTHGNELLPSHLKALADMKNCRNSGSLLMMAECDQCHHQAFLPHSCGHRSCPHCQHFDCQQWLERQRKKLLPVDYFMVTFTLPAQLRKMAWLNQKRVYSLLFSLAWETLTSFGLKDKKLQGKLGATAVLHTNTRALDFHPHVHFIVPAGSINEKHTLWRKKSGEYLFHEKNMAKVFHAKWIDAIKQSELTVKETIPSQWIIDCAHVGQGNKALTYLGKYLYRGVLPEKNILKNQDGQVTFCYTDNKGVRRTRKLPGGDFLWLLLRHVLPRGFRRARDYGFLHGNAKRMMNLIRYVLRCFTPPTNTATPEKRATFCCSQCRGSMRIIATRLKSKTNLLPVIIDT